MEIHTQRLLLRLPCVDDVQPMFEIHQDPEVMRFVGKSGDISVAWRNVAMMIGHWHMLGYGMWILVERSTGQVIGRAGLWNEAGGPGLELGWLIRRSSWGRGFATEAASAALEWARQQLGADHVISVIHADNRPSIRIAEKLGQQLEQREVIDGSEMLTYGIRWPLSCAAMAHPSQVRLLSSVPVFLVDDVNATAAWYREHLGFETAGIFPPKGAAAWASLQRDGAEIMLQRLKGHRKENVYDRRDGGVWNAYIRLTGVATLYEMVKGKPFVKKTLEREPYGDWDFEVVDLNGYVLVFGGDESVSEQP